jgi:hypothetical protein
MFLSVYKINRFVYLLEFIFVSIASTLYYRQYSNIQIFVSLLLLGLVLVFSGIINDHTFKKLLVTQFVNLNYNENDLNTREYFEHSFGRTFLLMIFV